MKEMLILYATLVSVSFIFIILIIIGVAIFFSIF